MLAMCYMNLGAKDKSLEMQNNAVKKIKYDSEANSSPEDKKGYINNGLHQQISAPLRAYSIEDGKKQNQCPGCGQEVQPGFSFCPACGSKV